MKIGISQPTLFPWIGFFNIIKNCDIFVFLDNVKFEKSSWQMRNKLKNVSKTNESELWVRIPTKSVKSNTLIKDVLIDNQQNWKHKHVNTFIIHYGDALNEIEFLQKMYEKKWEKLVNFNIEFIQDCCKFLDISTKMLRASDLLLEGKKSELVLNICKKFSATEYLANSGSKIYLENDKSIFEKENIKISYHEFKHPMYKQKGHRFIEKLSILDLLFNEKYNAKVFI